ncbi:MAG: TonB-dependent receptor [Oceanicaulis sp.]
MAIFKKLSYGASVAALLALAPVAAVEAQQTSASLRGSITAEAGAPVDGASVTLVHLPTATVSTATTSEGGSFSLSNLRVGGPYRISIQQPGFEPQIIENVFLAAGRQDPLRVTLRPASQTDTIVVRGQRIDSLSLDNGVGSVFSSRDLESQPTLNRDFTDILARDPLVRSNGTGELSIAGISPSLNSLTIDGVESGEQFGINSDGIFPTQRPPIDIDAIESVSVAITDFTVLNNGFRGGLINVVTKSGTNEFDGNVGFYYADESFSGDEAFDREVRTSDFTEEELSINIGGPIIKDKLFFFASYSDFERTDPLTFNFRDTDPEIFNIIRDLTQDLYGYDPGDKFSVANENATERLRLRFDWNITDDHRATFSYGNVEETQIGSFSTFDFPTSARTEDLENTTYTGELFSNWTDNLSTLFRVGYKESTFGRTPIGEAGGTAGSSFANFQIEDIDPNDPYFAANGLDGAALIGSSPIDIDLGPAQFDQANAILDELFTLYGEADYVLGDHTITGGFNFESYEVTNVFVPGSAGVVVFDGLSGFANQVADPSRGAGYFVNRPGSGQIEDGITFFSYDQLSLFVQDAWTVTPELELTFGLRYETYTDANETPDRLDTTDLNGVTRSFEDLYGIRGDATIDGVDVILPRFGFNWAASDRLTVRGGFGGYSGGDEQVAFANQYVPPLFSAEIDVLNNVDGRSIPQAALDEIANNQDGSIVETFGVLDPNFEIPVEWRTALAVDYNLDLSRFGMGDGYELTAQMVHSRADNALFWRNLGWERDDVPATGVSPDGRPIYPNMTELGLRTVIELTNADEGESTFFTLSAAKAYENGISFDLSYTNSSVEELNPLTSERAVSQFRGQVSPARNTPQAFTSVNEVEHTFNLYLEYERDFFRDLTTTIGLFGQVESGEPINYGFRSFNHLFGNAAAPREFAYGNNDPIYIPQLNAAGDGFDDPIVRFRNAGIEADFLEFIEAEDLVKYAGSVAPAYAGRGPWTQRWDFSFEQELPGIWGAERFVGDNNLKLTVDVVNFLNLLNNDWGQQLRGPGFNGLNVVRADLIDVNTGNTIEGALGEPVCGVDTQCIYEYHRMETDASGAEVIEENFNASVWRARVGIRYEF